MSEQVSSFGELERWEGGFPGEHEFSTLEGLEALQHGNDKLDVLFSAASKLTDHWNGNHFAGLYLYGTPGTGKTHAALGLGRQLHEAGAEVHYRYVGDLDDNEAFRTPRNGEGITSTPFPAQHRHGAVRNSKSVLILDDYQPVKHSPVTRAIEASAQYGGLVVITSNYEDPFKLLESPLSVTSTDQVLTSELLQRVDPETHAANQRARAQQEKELSDSLRSRIAAGFKFIEFSGPDYRIENRFWK